MSEHRKTYQARDGVRRTMIWEDEKPDQVVVHTEQALDEILDGIARDREILNQRGEIKHVARIPAVIADKYLTMDEDEQRRWLNSSEGAPWRTWEGKV